MQKTSAHYTYRVQWMANTSLVAALTLLVTACVSRVFTGRYFKRPELQLASGIATGATWLIYYPPLNRQEKEIHRLNCGEIIANLKQKNSALYPYRRDLTRQGTKTLMDQLKGRLDEEWAAIAFAALIRDYGDWRAAYNLVKELEPFEKCDESSYFRVVKGAGFNRGWGYLIGVLVTGRHDLNEITHQATLALMTKEQTALLDVEGLKFLAGKLTSRHENMMKCPGVQRALEECPDSLPNE